MKKTILFGVIVIVLIIAAVICLTILIPPILFDLILPNPPEPQIQYGEFPFEIVLEIDGEAKTFNDIYICEYDGIGSNEGVGKYRTWKGYIKGTGKGTILIKEVDNKHIYCSVGAADIYMGDCEPYYEGGEIPVNEPVIYSKEHDKNGGTTSHTFNETDMEEHGIKIISYNFSPPITNLFE